MTDKTPIVFYRKVCGGIFFISVNDEHFLDHARDIARYIKQGHSIAKISLNMGIELRKYQLTMSEHLSEHLNDVRAVIVVEK